VGLSNPITARKSHGGSHCRGGRAIGQRAVVRRDSPATDRGVRVQGAAVSNVGRKSGSALAAVQRAAESTGEMNLGVTGVAPLNAASSSTARYSLIARLDASGGRPGSPGTLRSRLASALIRLASTAKPSPPTRPSKMHRRRTVSDN